jgi:uridine kinase
MRTKESLGATAAMISQARERLSANRALLVAVSGIDASGKSYLTDRLALRLQESGIRAEALHADGWLNLPHTRFSSENPAEHFYEHAFRFEEMFAELVEPLRQCRSVSFVADYTDETALGYRRHLYEFRDVDVILLEGILLLKQAYRPRYDLSFWIDCTFETALERAISRAQEGLTAAETVRAYETIYFPAQRIHLDRDWPRSMAHLWPNDPRLSAS